jgi:ubiquinone/menaquinone biosynthesis C-methylase UbiE
MPEPRTFDQKAATWDEEPRRVALAGAVAEGIRNCTVLTREMNILDFGCGTGLLTLNLQPYVRSITGMDTSRGMLDRLAEKIEHQKLDNVSLYCGDFSKGERPDGSFHLVTSAMTLHHVADIPGLFAVLHGLLAPGGVLCLADLDKEDGTFHDDPAGVHHSGFDRALLKADLTAAGFTVFHDTIVTRIRKGPPDTPRDYPVFLVCARGEPRQ